jgi:hypothetical protein
MASHSIEMHKNPGSSNEGDGLSNKKKIGYFNVTGCVSQYGWNISEQFQCWRSE